MLNVIHSTDETELKQKKFEVFQENMKLVQHLNRIERGTAHYGMTKFMDLTSLFTLTLCKTESLFNTSYIILPSNSISGSQNVQILCTVK